MYHRFLLSIIAIAAISVSGCSSPVTRVAGEPFATHTALIQTTMGDIEVELYGEDAPKTVENFVGLANKGYYDGILFHRVISGFMIQGGDPNTKDPSKSGQWGMGGESIYGAKFADELNPEAPSYKRGYKAGVLAMANSGANTNGSQFFIMHVDFDRLPKNYSMFGKVTKGMEVVNAIATTPRDECDRCPTMDRPNIPVAITTIKARKQ